MRRIAISGRRAALLAALALVPALWACESQISDPSVPRPRVYRVAMADGQLLPAHRECPAPVEGMITGTHFVEGELILYPERTFTWRYTIQQYAALQGMQQAWVEPVTVQGTYIVRGDSLHLMEGAIASRKGQMVGERLALGETVPCHYPVEGQEQHVAQLELAPAEGQD